MYVFSYFPHILELINKCLGKLSTQQIIKYRKNFLPSFYVITLFQVQENMTKIKSHNKNLLKNSNYNLTNKSVNNKVENNKMKATKYNYGIFSK